MFGVRHRDPPQKRILPFEKHHLWREAAGNPAENGYFLPSGHFSAFVSKARYVSIPSCFLSAYSHENKQKAAAGNKSFSLNQSASKYTGPQAALLPEKISQKEDF